MKDYVDYKDRLSNVYFIAGTNCGGKSSMTKYLAEKYGMHYYSADEEYWTHRKLSNPVDQPAMNRPFIDWDEFFNRETVDKATWLHQSMIEEIPFILEDLKELSSIHDRVIVDMHCVPDVLEQVSDYSRVIFLLADPELVYKEYFSRTDKNDMYQCILKNTTNPEKSIENTRILAKFSAEREIERAMQSGFKYHYRTMDITLEERAVLVAKHFKIKQI